MKLLLFVDKLIGLVFDKFFKKFYFLDNLMYIIRLMMLYRENIMVFYILGICFNMFVKNDCFLKLFIYVIICYCFLFL